MKEGRHERNERNASLERSYDNFNQIKMKARQIKTSSCRVKLRHDQIKTLQRQFKMKTLYHGEID